MSRYSASSIGALVPQRPPARFVQEKTLPPFRGIRSGAVRTAERARAVGEAQLRAGTIDPVTLLKWQQVPSSVRNTLVLAQPLRF